VNGILLRALPYPQSDRLVDVSHSITVPGVDRVDQADATFLLYQRLNSVFDNIGAYRANDLNLGALVGGQGDAARVDATGVSASLFPTLRISPARGRTFSADDDRVGAPRVVILSNALWLRKFGGDPSVVGKNVIVDGAAREIIGVMPRDFGFPTVTTELWYPLQLDPNHAQPGSFNYKAVARLKPGVTPEAAVADLSRLLPRLLDDYPGNFPREMFENAHLRPVIKPLHEVVVGDIGRLLWIVFGAVGLLLAIACANVANLFLVRAEGRQRELAVRTALGAARSSLLMQYLSESFLLAVLGGAAGLGLAAAALQVFKTSSGGLEVPRINEVGVDAASVGFAIVACAITAIVVSLVPLLRTRQVSVASILKESGRSATSGAERQRTRSLLVMAQIALALVLVAASGLLARSFARLRDVKPGFNANGVLTLRLSLPPVKYPTSTSRAQMLDELTRQVRAVPGVRDAAITSRIPLTSDIDNTVIAIEDLHLAPNALPPLHEVSYVGNDYFSTMQIPMISGRRFGIQDPARRQYEAIVSESFAKRYYKNESPLGHRIIPGTMGGWYTIVGVVGDVHLKGLDQPAEETAYFPLVSPTGTESTELTEVPQSVALAVRTAGDPNVAAAAVRKIVHELDPGLPTYGEESMQAIVRASSARARFLMTLLGTASAMALLLGAVGLYGVMAYGVSLRQREIGVRIALGAQPGEVSQMISRQGLALAVGGVIVGLGAAVGVTRFLRGLLYDVSPTDPLTLTATCVALLVVAFIASWLPARRAAALDPALILRSD
jgi:predicted permease